MRGPLIRQLGSDIHLSIIDASPDGMIVVNSEGVIELANTRAQELFRQDLRGLSVDELVPQGQREQHHQLRSGYTADPHTRPMGSGLQLAGLRADGSEFPIEISLSPGYGEAQGLIIATVRDISERQVFEHERERVREELAIQQERRAMANDLHDDLVQSLYALGLTLPALRRDEAVSKTDVVDQVASELAAAIADLRAYVVHLREVGEGDQWPLRERLRHLVDALPSPPRWGLGVHGELGDHTLQRHTYLIVKELTSNIVRHAEAEEAMIEIVIGDADIGIEVEDDGTGFVEGEVAMTSLGLRSMQERVNALGGSMLIETAASAGTAVRIELPHPR